MCVNIVSWNTFGGGIAKLAQAPRYTVRQDMPNIFFVQEGGSVGGIPDEVEIGGELYKTFFFKQPDDGSHRLSIGILLQEKAFDEYEIGQFPGPGKRPIVYYESDDFIAATAHLTACSAVAKDELKRLNDTMKDKYTDKHWLVMGDFNCEPESLDASALGLNIYTPGYLTHNGEKTLDFLICSDSFNGHLEVDIASDDSGFTANASDHYPIRCIVNL